MGEVTVTVPSDLVRILKVDRDEVPRVVRLYLAVELYREGLISLGKAAEIAGLSKWEMMEVLASKGVPLNYNRRDLEEDIEILERLV
ncbi:UPF0175 family protein [Thermococcus sp.]|uniref:UPF0175 family protein n=1 Tax=Thermococcus sp. TaxID=35749 RepID=UPI0025DF59AD|nr:UPF0175 family protein [Thermococcus sp.]